MSGPPLTPEQEGRVREIVREEIAEASKALAQALTASRARNNELATDSLFLIGSITDQTARILDRALGLPLAVPQATGGRP
jgi:plasmid maintenance system antidote protein VapI